ncbi:PAS domain-containing protein [Pseudanabaena mucicola]|uniref:PAS domain-containing protein n=1 Tax=Pseudanabaena mucicola FACHB-723 TaxID=2692860 RepID=A0ABR7ZUE7_9CYAN|nr:PAS domain-containing protein [Pseudanabaena mucicola]MBD2187596.1 PAS domain-containing protein [Pseudanabaena mucicola FACHB-723]
MVVLLKTLRSRLHNIPVQWMVALPFVLQIIGSIGIIVTYSHQNWAILICGMLLLFSSIFAVWANRCINQKIGILELDLQQVQEKYKLLFEALPVGTIITEAALRQIESRLQAFLDNAPTPISIKDLEGTYLSVNPEFAYLMKLSEEQILGKKDYDLFDNQAVKRFHDMELQAIFEGIAVNFEETLKFSDSLQTFIITKFPIMDTHGKPYAVAGIYLSS